MRLSRAQKMMVEDGFPKELFRTAAQRHAYWEANPPRAMPLFEINKTRDESPETTAFRTQEEERRRLKSLQSISRMKARMETKKIDFSKVRWDAIKCKFVPLEGQAPKLGGGQETDRTQEARTAMSDHRMPTQNSGTAREAPMKRDRVAPPRQDPIWFRVNKDTAATLARLNGVWDARYEKLSGGLLVMTITNRLKGLVKKGGEVNGTRMGHLARRVDRLAQFDGNLHRGRVPDRDAAVNWQPMDSAPKDGTRIRIRNGPDGKHEDMARWHPNGLWVAGWTDVSFVGDWQPLEWRYQTSEDDRRDAEMDIRARYEELNKMTNSGEFIRRMNLEYDKAFKK